MNRRRRVSGADDGQSWLMLSARQAAGRSCWRGRGPWRCWWLVPGAASAAKRVSEEIDGRGHQAGDAGQPRQGRDPQGRAEEGAQRPRPQPGHVGERGLLPAAGSFLVSETDDWQVWAIERRENLLEDHSMVDQAKARMINGDQLFDYYLGYLTDESVTTTTSRCRTPRSRSRAAGGCGSR